MRTDHKLPFLTLLLMISFASVNAVLFTPALPAIARHFMISSNTARQTMTWFLIGYALGQLLYGPLANRFGRKPALYMGICLQILSSVLCILASSTHSFALLLLGRFLLALGSGVGLKMTFTLVNESYAPKIASAKISYLMLSFAVTPGLGVALGGILTTHFGWRSCFYACAVYGLILLTLVIKLPETLKNKHLHALQITHLIQGYKTQFQNKHLVAGGLLMGLCTSVVYVFAALAPFIAIDLFGMSSSEYGIANILPPMGLLFGSLFSAKLAQKYPLKLNIKWGITITTIGTILMTIAILAKLPELISLFLVMIVIYFGMCFILANSSSIAMSYVEDKAHGSAVMSFLNMGTATIIVLTIGFFTVSKLLLPLVFLVLCAGMIAMYRRIIQD